MAGHKIGLLAAALALALCATPGGQAQNSPTLPELRTRAEQDDTEAQNALGNAYTNALLGLRQDHTEALRWYRLAAAKTFAPAQFNLGLAHELGRGVPVDEREAFRYYLLAAEQGFTAALFNVGNMYATGRGVAQDLFEANVWYRQAADKGLVEAQFNLGLAYEAGRGVAKDEAQAARWYRQAAEQGYPLALYNLGLLFEDGRGVAKDDRVAASLYRAAATLGVASAQNNYGLMLAEGRGELAKDPAEAYVWLSLAVDGGVSPTARDTIAQALTPAQLDAARRSLADLRAGKTAAKPPAPVAPEPAAAPGPGAPPATAAEAARYKAEVAALSARLEQTTADLNRLQQDNQRLRQNARPAGAGTPDEPTTFKSKFPVSESDPAVVIAGLKRDNLVLNEEVRRAARELQWLKQQRQESDKAPTDGSGGSTRELRAAQAEVTRLTEELNAARAARPAEGVTAGQVTLLNNRVRQLTAELGLAQSGTPPAGDGSAALVQFQQQVQLLQNEKADLEKWVQALERTLQDQSDRPAPAETPAQLVALNTALDEQTRLAQKLTEENRTLADRIRQAEEMIASLGSRNPDVSEITRLQRQIVELQQGAVKSALDRESQAKSIANARDDLKEAQSRVTALERDLRDAQGATGRLNATTAELTELNDKLKQELATARVAASARGVNLAAEPEFAALETKLASALREIEKGRTRISDLEADLAASRQALSGGAAQVNTELVQVNLRLQREQDDMRRLVESYRADLVRQTQNPRLAEPSRLAAAPTGPQPGEDISAQVAQLRRELEGARAAQSRQAEASAAQERERAALIAQLRTENGALAARLTQTQGTIDQIAGSLRLAGPAASIVASGVAPTGPVPAPAAEVRTHTVAQGDSLSRLSQRYYGTPNRWQEIYQANSEVLQNSSTLRIGQQLRIP